MTQEAMKQALEFFESGNFVYPTKIATDLRQAIAELESQEPVAWITLQKEAQQIVESKILWKKFIDGTPFVNDISCWMADFALQHTNPPQRTWVGLTDDDEIPWDGVDAKSFARAIEAKLKQLNT
jgi:hypothetical protein